MASTNLSDIPVDIIQTHIFPRLDAPSLSATTTASSYLHHLSSDPSLWSNISNSTWPSITHPRVTDVISTFPSTHRSFFHDSFPSLTFTHVNHPGLSSSHPLPSEFISAVDIRYQNDIVYSAVHFTDASSNFLSSPLRIELSDDPTRTRSGSKQMPRVSRSIDLEVDEIVCGDEAMLSHLKEALTLTWILIDPTRKRACNLSSVKPVSVRQDWACYDMVAKYVVVLPGVHPNEMVQCKIHVVLGVSAGAVGLHVKHVTLTMEDLNCRFLKGREFLVITTGALLEESNVKRKVVDDEVRLKCVMQYKELKRGKKESERIVKRGQKGWEDGKREFAVKKSCVFMLVLFCFLTYFLVLLL